MTPSNYADAPPLLTDADVLLRVEQLIGPAAAERRLWIMWVDGDGRVQADDRAWAEAMAATCERAETWMRGSFLSTRGGVRRLR